ncbi:hypothetical protein [Acetobacter senegalensis]|uniref:hypothetical protein n=1 Tax=Acetobacter senegalensis TaxID=446692 RepID=UPI00128D58B1|nr:hypothetical protein [Acetobacter senegalensis]MPQ75079.1 hypothetical protein [Acetobacter senegalensis]
MAKAARYMRDESALDNGQAIEVGPEGDKFTITTRGFTTAYIDRLAALQRAAAIRLNTGLPPASTDRVTPDTLPPSVQDDCQAQALAEKCLLDISGLENMDGSPMTIEQFKDAIRKRANMGLLVLALQAAGSVGMASKALLEDAEKNSQPPSAG